jgi:hypothetical protein
MPATYLTPFRPSLHGFRFGNGFRNLWGASPTFGRCNGISEVALDYFFANQPIPDIAVVDYGLGPISGLGAASWDANNIELYVRRDEDVLAGKRIVNDTPADWTTLFGNRVTGSPAAASGGWGRLDVVVRGMDGTYWRNATGSGRWYGSPRCVKLNGYSQFLGGPFDSSPAVAAPFPERIEVWGRRGDSLYFTFFDPGTHDWSPMGRPDGIALIGDPAAASQSGSMICVIQGSDRAYWVCEWKHNQWQPWYSIGGRFTSSPAIASPFPGRFEVYGRGDDGGIWIKVYESGGWGSWAPLHAPPPGINTERPAATSHHGHMAVYAIGNDRNVWRRRWSNGWQDWDNAEMPVTADSRRLTDHIYARNWETINTIIGSIGSLGIGLAFAGSAGKYISLRGHSDEQLYQWASNDEVTKIVSSLAAGRPIPLGLLGKGQDDHEVVAWGVEIDADSPTLGRSGPGPYTFIHIYDPNYPGCDNIVITLDPDARSMVSAPGGAWRALWARDDVPQLPPPV